MEFNVTEMSLRDLLGLKKKVDSAVVSYEDRKRRLAHSELEAIAKELGFNLSDLLGVEKKGKAATRSPAPKYRHIENHKLTWSGRGRKPRWLDQAEIIPFGE